MFKDNRLTRAEFMKLLLFSSLSTVAAGFLASCSPSPTLSPLTEADLARAAGLPVDQYRAAIAAAKLTSTLTGTPTPTLTPTPTPGQTAVATRTSSPIVETIYEAASRRRAEWTSVWPDTAEKVTLQLGGTASQWVRNNEWPDNRFVDDTFYHVSEYVNREWRPANAGNLPFKWPKTPQEALQYFFPGQQIDVRFIQPAWIDPQTKLVTGWHLSEDHWLIAGQADVAANIHTGEVAEGYTVKGTLDPADDRNWVVFGGFRPQGQGSEPSVKVTQLSLQAGQGMTIWMPGTDPNALALRMEPWPAADTPYYMGPNHTQLGPEAFGFTPIYPAANFVNR